MQPTYLSSLTAIWGFFSFIRCYIEMKERGEAMDVCQRSYIGSILMAFETNLQVRRFDPLDFEDFKIRSKEQFFEELLTIAFTVYKVLPKELFDFVENQLPKENGEIMFGEELMAYFQAFAESKGLTGWQFEKINRAEFVVYRDRHLPTELLTHEGREKTRKDQTMAELMHLRNTIFHSLSY